MIADSFSFFKEQIKESTGSKRFFIILLGPCLISVLLLLAEWGCIEILSYFQVIPSKAEPIWLLLCFLCNVLLIYSVVIYNVFSSKDSMINVGFDRVNVDLLKLIKTGKKNIDLIGLSLKPFAREDIFNTFYKLIEQDVTIRILLLNPFTLTALIRPQNLYAGKSTLCSETVDSLIEFVQFSKYLKSNYQGKFKNFEVRLYSQWPTVSMFRVDEHINFSVYLQSSTGLKSPYFICNKNKKANSLYSNLVSNFDVLWSTGISINDNEWLGKVKNIANEQKRIDTDSDSFLMQKIKLLEDAVLN